MKINKKILQKLYQVYKKAYCILWIKKNSQKGNIHMPAKSAVIKKIPFSREKVWLRPTTSDVSRVGEFINEIYFEDCYLHSALKAKKPNKLIDVGANIGLSSLSLMKEFQLKTIIAIEAEAENFGVLKKNFELWSQEFPETNWIPIHGCATNELGAEIFSLDSLSTLTRNNSASGTFRYSNNPKELDKSTEKVTGIKAITLNEIFLNILDDEKVICKIDIEGGEEILFKSNTDWVNKCIFITSEIHDRFHPCMINSSRNMIDCLTRSNFAAVPNENIIHFYNRDLIQ